MHSPLGALLGYLNRPPMLGCQFKRVNNSVSEVPAVESASWCLWAGQMDSITPLQQPSLNLITLISTGRPSRDHEAPHCMHANYQGWVILPNAFCCKATATGADKARLAVWVQSDSSLAAAWLQLHSPTSCNHAASCKYLQSSLQDNYLRVYMPVNKYWVNKLVATEVQPK